MNSVAFPLIIPIDEDNKIYKGYIPIQVMNQSRKTRNKNLTTHLLYLLN